MEQKKTKQNQHQTTKRNSQNTPRTSFCNLFHLFKVLVQIQYEVKE